MKLAAFLVASLFCILQMASYVTAAMWFAEPSHLRYPGECYHQSTGHIQPGENRVYNMCASATCYPSGKITFKGCAKPIIEDLRCHVTKEDLSKPYPDCCPQIVC